MTNIAMLISSVAKRNKLQNKFLKHSISLLSDLDSAMLDSYLKYCLGNGLSFEFLAEAYDLFSKDTLKEQVFFIKHKRYRFSTYNEVAYHVYQNNEYMSKYMYGLALTSFLWPNHLQVYKFFRNKLPKNLKGSYLDIGPGHGMFMMEAMRLSSYINFWGIDVSSTSVEITKNILSSGYFGQFKNYNIIHGDFLEWNTREKFDAIVMGEVLEHIENPCDFLYKVRSLSTHSSYIYMSTAINSPVIDHIYLFESKEHLMNLIESCSFSIQDMLVVPYTGKTIEESETNKLPIKIALVLKNNYG
jgi:2-polyprenyl-3-methyl-5-hydroxy-6-metoxy-1,4-benzoquinol methylase